MANSPIMSFQSNQEMCAQEKYADQIKNVKTCVRAIMASTQQSTFSYIEILRDYETIENEPMPTCGFRTQIDFLNSMPDVVQVIKGPRGTPNRLSLVPSHKSHHIVTLVKQQTDTELKKKLRKKELPSEFKLQSLGIRMPPRNSMKRELNLDQQMLNKSCENIGLIKMENFKPPNPAKTALGCSNSLSSGNTSSKNARSIAEMFPLDFLFYDPK